eukprot:jgi/Mesvir1/17165/Mv07588-RA.1
MGLSPMASRTMAHLMSMDSPRRTLAVRGAGPDAGGLSLLPANRVGGEGHVHHHRHSTGQGHVHPRGAAHRHHHLLVSTRHKSATERSRGSPWGPLGGAAARHADETHVHHHYHVGQLHHRLHAAGHSTHKSAHPEPHSADPLAALRDNSPGRTTASKGGVGTAGGFASWKSLGWRGHGKHSHGSGDTSEGSAGTDPGSGSGSGLLSSPCSSLYRSGASSLGGQDRGADAGGGGKDGGGDSAARYARTPPPSCGVCSGQLVMLKPSSTSSLPAQAPYSGHGDGRQHPGQQRPQNRQVAPPGEPLGAAGSSGMMTGDRSNPSSSSSHAPALPRSACLSSSPSPKSAPGKEQLGIPLIPPFAPPHDGMAISTGCVVVSVLACGHVFHGDCLDAATKGSACIQDPACPVC